MIKSSQAREPLAPSHVPQPTSVALSLADPELREQLSALSFRAFLDTMTFLNVAVADALRLLGDLPAATYYRYASNGAHHLDRDTLERISVILGIVKALRLIFADDEAGRRWLHAANTDVLFDGRTPLANMLQGSIAGFYAVRSYLDAWRHGVP